MSLSTKHTATLGSHDSGDDDVSLFESDISDDDNSSFRDKTLDKEPNFQDSKFNGVPFRIEWMYKDGTPDDGTKYKGNKFNDLSFQIKWMCQTKEDAYVNCK